MPYPSLSSKQATVVARKIMEIVPSENQADVHIDASLYLDMRKGDFDEAKVVATSSKIRSEWDTAVNSLKKQMTDTDLVQFEIQFAPKIFRALGDLSLDCLEDEDFWRYLALFPFRWYLIAREPELKPQDFGGIQEVFVVDKDGKPVLDQDGTQKIRLSKSTMINQLIYRTYLIGKAMEDTSEVDHFERVSAVPRGGPLTDVWQSHIIRVVIGRIGLVRHAFIDRIRKEPIEKSRMFDFARELAKKITRVKNNVVLDNKSKPEIDALMKEFGDQI